MIIIPTSYSPQTKHRLLSCWSFHEIPTSFLVRLCTPSAFHLSLSLSLHLFHLLKSRMEAVGGAALYSFSGVLFGMLTSSDVDEFARQNHFQTELEKLRKLQVRIVGVMNNVENKQMSKPLVKIWLDEAYRLMYVVDNMWDDFQALTRTKGRSQSTTSNARSLIPTFCTCFVDTALFRLRLRKREDCVLARPFGPNSFFITQLSITQNMSTVPKKNIIFMHYPLFII